MQAGANHACSTLNVAHVVDNVFTDLRERFEFSCFERLLTTLFTMVLLQSLDLRLHGESTDGDRSRSISVMAKCSAGVISDLVE